MGRAIADRRERVFLMTKVCTPRRDARVAMRQLAARSGALTTGCLELRQAHAARSCGTTRSNTFSGSWQASKRIAERQHPQGGILGITCAR